MNTLRMSPLDRRRCIHAPDGIASEGGRSRDCRRGPQQGSSSQSRGQPGAHAGVSGSGRAGGADPGGAGCGTHGFVAHPGVILARRLGAGAVRRGSPRPPAHVRHGRGGAGHGVGVLGAARRTQALDDGRTRARRPARVRAGQFESRDGAPHAQKNDLKPWRRLMWCIGELTQEYRRRMYELLALYAQPFDPREPVVCIDEKSLQLVGHSRAPLSMQSGVIAKDDYEYVRNGTSNLFVAVEPKAGQRVVSVTERRGKVDFVEFIASLLGGVYATARRVHVGLDNLNIHFRKCRSEEHTSELQSPCNLVCRLLLEKKNPSLRGLYSIKSVLPALFPSMSYDTLEIGDGGTAIAAFFSLYQNPVEINKIRTALLKYCQ